MRRHRLEAARHTLSSAILGRGWRYMVRASLQRWVVEVALSNASRVLSDPAEIGIRAGTVGSAAFCTASLQSCGARGAGYSCQPLIFKSVV